MTPVTSRSFRPVPVDPVIFYFYRTTLPTMLHSSVHVSTLPANRTERHIPAFPFFPGTSELQQES